MPTEQEAEAAGMDLHAERRSIRARGLVHRIQVLPNENHTGWIVAVDAPSGAANLPQAQAEILGRLLLAGPGADPRPQCSHGKALVDLCQDCLTDADE